MSTNLFADSNKAVDSAVDKRWKLWITTTQNPKSGLPPQKFSTGVDSSVDEYSSVYLRFLCSSTIHRTYY